VLRICHWESWREYWLGCKGFPTLPNLSVCVSMRAFFFILVLPQAKRANRGPGNNTCLREVPLASGMCPVQSRPKCTKARDFSAQERLPEKAWAARQARSQHVTRLSPSRSNHCRDCSVSLQDPTSHPLIVQDKFVASLSSSTTCTDKANCTIESCK
jgi:hypothetical protein